MDPELDVIESEVRATRDSLAQKLEKLEAHVADSVEEVTTVAKETVTSAADAVQETVESVKDTVHDTVESFGDALSLKHHAEKRPWLVAGGAVVTGYLVASYLLRPKDSLRMTAEDRQALIESLAGDPRFCATAAEEAVDEVQGKKSKSPSLLGQGMREAGFAVARALIRAAILRV